MYISIARIIPLCKLCALLLRKIATSITQWQIQQRILQQQMKHNVPAHKTRNEAKHTTGFLQRNRGRLMPICCGKVARCDCEKAQVHKEKHQYVRKIAM